MKRNELEPGALAILESIENWDDSPVKEFFLGWFDSVEDVKRTKEVRED